jgi:hypothetical protein
MTNAVVWLMLAMSIVGMGMLSYLLFNSRKNAAEFIDILELNHFAAEIAKRQKNGQFEVIIDWKGLNHIYVVDCFTWSDTCIVINSFIAVNEDNKKTDLTFDLANELEVRVNRILKD